MKEFLNLFDYHGLIFILYLINKNDKGNLNKKKLG